MEVKTFIEKAEEGGCNLKEIVNFPKDFDINLPFVQYIEKMCLEKFVLNPEVWQAVGKVEGWSEWTKDIMTEFGDSTNERDITGGKTRMTYRLNAPYWKYQMHRMIDALAEGKTIEEFIKTL